MPCMQLQELIARRVLSASHPALRHHPTCLLQASPLLSWRPAGAPSWSAAGPTAPTPDPSSQVVNQACELTKLVVQRRVCSALPQNLRQLSNTASRLAGPLPVQCSPSRTRPGHLLPLQRSFVSCAPWWRPSSPSAAAAHAPCLLHLPAEATAGRMAARDRISTLHSNGARLPSVALAVASLHPWLFLALAFRPPAFLG